MELAEELLTIDIRLRFALFGLECVLGVSFSRAECERVFRDASEDQATAKQYNFYESPRLAVTGRVEEYEPESVWVQVRGGPGSRDMLRRVAEAAELAAIRMRESTGQDAEPGAAAEGGK